MTSSLLSLPKSAQRSRLSKIVTNFGSSRKRMVFYLSTLGSRYRHAPDSGAHAIAFNVKLPYLDIGGESLANIALYGPKPLIDVSMVPSARAGQIKCEIAQAASDYNRGGDLFAAALMFVTNRIVSGGLVWPGDDPTPDYDIQFVGRSGGWMVLERVGSLSFVGDRDELFESLHRTQPTGDPSRVWEYEVPTSDVVAAFKVAALMDVAAQTRYATVEREAAEIVVNYGRDYGIVTA